MSKADQIRALRERAYEERLEAPNYDGVRAKLKMQLEVNNVNNGLSNRPVINRAPDGLSLSNAQRQAKWRKANADLNRQRARDGMRRRRAGGLKANAD